MEIKLSNKEQEYCKWFVVFKGDSKKISKQMKVTITTEARHRSNIYNKLTLFNKWELMYYLLKNNPIG